MNLKSEKIEKPKKGNESGTELFLQREISWNSFNERVFKSGFREYAKLLDCLKFTAITSSNYDEFFMVRIARLMKDAKGSDIPLPPTNEKPSEVLPRLLAEMRRVIMEQDNHICDFLLPSLKEEGIIIREAADWTDETLSQAESIFGNQLLPVCTPLLVRPPKTIADVAIQPGIYTAFLINQDDLELIRLPGNMERFYELEGQKGVREFLLLEDVLRVNWQNLYPDCQSFCFFRITRDADMTVDEERDEDFVAAMEEVLDNRKKGFIVRLETRGNPQLACRLADSINLDKSVRFHLRAPLGFEGFMKLAFLNNFDYLRTRLPTSSLASDLEGVEDLWETLKERDIFLHHPYESFLSVVQLVERAAAEPETLAIKMTLYRTSGDSPIVKALIRAARRGIQITVLVELKARFNEDENIQWAQNLEKSGAIVVYGLAELKVHAKSLIIVRREELGLQRYVHLSTGNYNDSTAKIYADMALMTSRDSYTKDVTLMFNAITGYSSEPQLETLIMGPFALRRETLRLIRREEQRAMAGEQAYIIAKMNSLVDREIIKALYEASKAGVRIDLNVRGVCCLRPGIPNLSENIRVVSVIDNFLEHTRAFAYHNGGQFEVYLSSADWMTRNLNRRVELLFPVADLKHKQRIYSILKNYFRDNCSSWELKSDGNWLPLPSPRNENAYRIQQELIKASLRVASDMEGQKKVLSVRRNLPTEGKHR